MIDCFRYYAGWADKIAGQTVPIRRQLLLLHQARADRSRRADHPLELPDADGRLEVGPCPGCRLYGGAQAGRANAVDALGWASWRSRPGFPAGVVNIVPGFGETAGAALVAHPGVDKMRSPARAAPRQIIMRSAAETLKRITFELGGKAPTSCSPMPISTRPSRGRCSGSISTRANAAAREPAVRPGVGLRPVRRSAGLKGQRSQAWRSVSTCHPAGSPSRQGPIRQDPVVHRQRTRTRGACVAGGERHGDKGFFIKPTIFADVKDDTGDRLRRDLRPGPVGDQVQRSR